MVVGLEAALDEGKEPSPILAALNVRRRDWPELGQPVVFWVPERVVGQLLRCAPDFFDWRSDTLFFPAVDRMELRPLGERTWRAGVDPRLSAVGRRARLKELSSRVRLHEESDDPVILRATAGWWDEMAEHLWLLGELDEALRIRREEEIPVYEKLGDVRERAITMGQIADVLQARGNLDEALRIVRDEALAPLDRLGDRNATSARLHLARLLLKRGSGRDRSEAREVLDHALAEAGRSGLASEVAIRRELDALRPAGWRAVVGRLFRTRSRAEGGPAVRSR